MLTILSKDVTTMNERLPKLIPNARLCSASDCTHFIPPHEEYKFKRCNLCRLLQDERRSLRQQGPTNQSDSSKPLGNVMKIYNLFASLAYSHPTACADFGVKKYLPVRSPTPGRCRSVDCGVDHDDDTTSCPQCFSRRAMLRKKAGLRKERLVVTSKYKQDEPVR